MIPEEERAVERYIEPYRYTQQPALSATEDTAALKSE
jgi:hypothetical protein